MGSVPGLTLEERLILACARTEADRPRITALVDLAPRWETVLRKTERWGLVPLVEHHLRPCDRVPDDVKRHLRHLRHRETVHGLARFELLRLMLVRFADARLPVIVLKGAALAALVYPSAALRPMRDIDLLIHRRDRDRADAIVRRVREELAASGSHGRNPYLQPDGLRALDVSEAFLTARGDDSPLPIDEFWARARPAVVGSVNTLVLSPEDMLLHLAFHLSAVANYAGQVRTLSDIGEVCRRYRDTIEWAALVDRTCAYGFGTQMNAVLHLAHEMVGADVPRLALSDLERRLGAPPSEEDLDATRRALLVDEPAEDRASTDGDSGTALEAEASSGTVSAPDAHPRFQAARRATGRGEVAVTHDQGGTDGVGSQFHRIFGLYALARALGVKYVHSGLRDVGYQGLMPMLNGRLDPAFTARYNAFFTLPSDRFDLENCEQVMVYYVDQAAVERYQAHAAREGRPVLIRGHLPYEYINYNPAGYQVLRTVSPYRGHVPAGPVRVCIHLRRGDNAVQGRERDLARVLANTYYVRVCGAVVDALRQLGVPFVVRLHTERPPRPYTLHPGIPGVYFNLDRPSTIDPSDLALEDFDAIANLEMVFNVEPRECLDDFATADVLILSLSSLGFVGGLLNPHGCVICPRAFHGALPDWLVATPEGELDAALLARRLAPLRDRAS